MFIKLPRPSLQHGQKHEMKFCSQGSFQFLVDNPWNKVNRNALDYSSTKSKPLDPLSCISNSCVHPAITSWHDNMTISMTISNMTQFFYMQSEEKLSLLANLLWCIWCEKSTILIIQWKHFSRARDSTWCFVRGRGLVVKQ